MGHSSRVMRSGTAYPARCAAAPNGSPVQYASTALGVERGGHVGRRHLDDLDVLGRHAFLGQHLAEKEKVDGEAAGDGDSLAGQILELLIGRSVRTMMTAPDR